MLGHKLDCEKLVRILLILLYEHCYLFDIICIFQLQIYSLDLEFIKISVYDFALPFLFMINPFTCSEQDD